MAKCEWLPLYICSNKDAELFEYMLNDPDYNCFEIDPEGLPIENDKVFEDLKRIKEKNKNKNHPHEKIRFFVEFVGRNGRMTNQTGFMSKTKGSKAHDDQQSEA